jgi:hypothetical protein
MIPSEEVSLTLVQVSSTSVVCSALVYFGYTMGIFWYMLYICGFVVVLVPCIRNALC